MATETGVWTLQEVRDKQLAGEWDYTDTTGLYTWGQNNVGKLGHNNQTNYSSPTQVLVVGRKHSLQVLIIRNFCSFLKRVVHYGE